MVPLVMIVAEIAFLRHCRIKPKHRKHNTQLHDEAHGGIPSQINPLPEQKRLAVGSGPPRGCTESVATSADTENEGSSLSGLFTGVAIAGVRIHVRRARAPPAHGAGSA